MTPVAPGPCGERGSAVAEYAMVAGLVLAVFLGVVQLALGLHVRALVVDAAAEGARVAARADSDLVSGVERTRALLDAALSREYASAVDARTTTRGGLDVVEVTVVTPLPVVGILGPSGAMSVSGHALEESQ